jgi:hypothetical protein
MIPPSLVVEFTFGIKSQANEKRFGFLPPEAA